MCFVTLPVFLLYFFIFNFFFSIFSLCSFLFLTFSSDVNKDWTLKDKDKDQAYKDQDKDKDLTHKDQDKDKDLNLVLKESLRTRTRINITDFLFYVFILYLVYI